MGRVAFRVRAQVRRLSARMPIRTFLEQTRKLPCTGLSGSYAKTGSSLTVAYISV